MLLCYSYLCFYNITAALLFRLKISTLRVNSVHRDPQILHETHSCLVFVWFLQKSRQIDDLKAAVEEYSSLTEVSVLNSPIPSFVLKHIPCFLLSNRIFFFTCECQRFTYGSGVKSVHDVVCRTKDIWVNRSCVFHMRWAFGKSRPVAAPPTSRVSFF